MPAGDQGKEQFANAITKLRNGALIVYIGQVFTLRNEILGNSELAARMGFDTPTQSHINDLLINCDKWRRHITYNPSGADLKTLEADASNLSTTIASPGGTGSGAQTTKSTAGGNDVARPAGALNVLPFALDGSDPNIKLLSQIEMRNPVALALVGAIDQHIVDATRLEDRVLSNRITQYSSLMLYAGLKDIWDMVNGLAGGDSNLLPISSGVLPSEEPQGPTASPNSKGEMVNSTGAATK